MCGYVDGVLGSCELIAFVSTADAARARRFYEHTLGLELEQQTPFACVFRAGETMLRVPVVADAHPVPYTVLGWAVPDIAECVRVLTERGVRFLRYHGLDQDALGIWRSPSGARVAWFQDPDANVLSLTEAGRNEPGGQAPE